MHIEQIALRNFRALRDVTVKDLPRMAFFVGANGTGKSTLLSVFGFLWDAMTTGVGAALTKMGGRRGFREVRSRDSDGPITIELKYRFEPGAPLATYSISIDEHKGRPVVEREVLAWRRLGSGRPWHFLDFKRGRGYAVANEPEEVDNVLALDRDAWKLEFPDILAIKSLAPLKRFPAVSALDKLLERWHLSDYHVGIPRRAPYPPPISAGTIKMLGYQVLLYDPDPSPLLCIKSPEKQLYPGVLEELAEAFRHYAYRAGQVLVSTHSPDFLNAAQVNEVFWLTKVNGCTRIVRARDDEQIVAYMNDGDKMGYLWKQGFFEGADPPFGEYTT